MRPCPRSTRPLAALLLLALAAPAAAQTGTLRERLLQVEDARDDAAAPALLGEGLRSPEVDTRRAAARALGRFERVDWLPLLAPALADRDVGVRRTAAWAAAQVAHTGEDARAAQQLLAARARTERDPAAWATLAANLGRLPYDTLADAQAADAVCTSVLPEPPGPSGTPAPAVRPGVRDAGMMALAAQPVALLGAVECLEARSRVSRKVTPLSPDALARLRQVAQVRAMIRTGDDTIVHIRRTAVAALVQSGAADAAVITTALGDGDDEVRRLAMVGVASEAAIDGREALITRGLGDGVARVRYEALRAWGRDLQKTSCAPVIAATGDRDAHVALQALDLLGAGCPDLTASLGALNEAVASLPAGDGAWHRAAHALVSFAAVAPAEARKALPRFVQHSTWQVRMYAARAAGRLAALDELDRLGRDPRANVREAALDALLGLERVEALPLAYDGLTRGDYPLVMTAAKALALEPDRVKATTALLAALARLTAEHRDTSRDPRVAILDRLAVTGGPAEAAALQPYGEDADPRVAAAARAALAKWTGSEVSMPPAAVAAAARPIPPRPGPPVHLADVRALEGAVLRITMAGRGTITLRLFTDEAPLTTLRVATLARAGHYDGLTFHRVVPNFVTQGGSPGASEYVGDARYMRDEPILGHRRGAVGISTRGRDTGDAQIFVDLVDVPRLDHQYTVFATVSGGMDVVDAVLEGDVMTRVEVVPAPPARR